jgi:hypothetical protein
MLKQSCTLCKIVGAIAIIGALNWGIVGLAQVNRSSRFLEPDRLAGSTLWSAFPG